MPDEIPWCPVRREVAICPECGHSLRMCIIHGHDIDGASCIEVFPGKAAVVCSYEDEVPHEYNIPVWEQTVARLRKWTFE